MAKRTVYSCDRCGGEADIYITLVVAVHRYRQWMDRSLYPTDRDFDLCEECSDSWKVFLGNKEPAPPTYRIDATKKVKL